MGAPDQAVVMFSGGAGSWGAAKRTVERYGAENTRLLFTDTLIEDEDLYRFLIEGSANVVGIEPNRGLVAQTEEIPKAWEPEVRKPILLQLGKDISAWSPA